MSNMPSDLKYSDDHEWVRNEGDGTATVGITDHAQEKLGDLVFVELPEVDKEVAQKEGCAVVESVKAASDVFSPLGGKIVAVNEALGDSPSLINDDPYGDGWIYRIAFTNAAELDALMDADGYADFVEKEDA